MSKKKRIGIPRALLYYRYKILWKTFFEKLGMTIVLSPPSNNEILERGLKESIDESCLSYKIFIGHVAYLENKSDFVLIPRIANYGKRQRTCMKFFGLYDNVKNLFPDINIISYNIEYTKNKFRFLGFIKMGLKISKNLFKIIYSYIIAVYKQKEYDLLQEKIQSQKLLNQKPKILLVAHPYNIYDKILGEPIINIIKEQNIELIFADKFSKKQSVLYSKDYSPTLYWKYSKELIGSISYYKNIVDGIIYLSSFPCGCDSLVNELVIRKERNLPSINLILDESINEVSLNTRLESFIDIVKERKKNG